MPVVYLDCFSGIAGDMTLAALLHLGADLEFVRDQVVRVAPPGLTLELVPVLRSGIDARQVKVRVAEEPPPEPRDYGRLRRHLENSTLDSDVLPRSLAVFHLLAEAESKVHALPLDQVHFHEVGAWDSIADVVGTAAALTCLDIDAVLASPIPLGRGFVSTAHGRLPLPAPATLDILAGVPVLQTDVPHELTTPTGAAIVKAFSRHFGPMPLMVASATGWGAGTRELADRPNLLRAVMGELQEAPGPEWLLETNLDDCSPELVGYVQERLLAEGALDVWLAPIQMKKNRPGVQLSVLCPDAARPRLKRTIFRETTAIGLRERPVARTRLDRQVLTVDTPLGPVRVKVSRFDGEVVNVAPEFEDVKALARAGGRSLKTVMAMAAAAARRHPGTSSPDETTPPPTDSPD